MWVSVWHDTRGWVSHVDARWRLRRRRAVFNGGMSLCDWYRGSSVTFWWVVVVGLAFYWRVGYLSYPMWSQFVWFRNLGYKFHWVWFTQGIYTFDVFWGII